MDNIVFVKNTEYEIIEPMLKGCPDISLIRDLKGGLTASYYYLNRSTRKLSHPFHFADRVYNDGFAPVAIKDGDNIFLTYYNPSKDLLLATRLSTQSYVLGDSDEDSVAGTYYRQMDIGNRTVVSRRINWPLLIAKDPINFYFVPNEKLQSKNFVRQCKNSVENYLWRLEYDDDVQTEGIPLTRFSLYYINHNKSPEDLEEVYKEALITIPTTASGYNKNYKEIEEKYFANATQIDDCYAAMGKTEYKQCIEQLFADKLAAAKVELEAQGKQCGDR